MQRKVPLVAGGNYQPYTMIQKLLQGILSRIRCLKRVSQLKRSCNNICFITSTPLLVLRVPFKFFLCSFSKTFLINKVRSATFSLWLSKPILYADILRIFSQK